MAAVDAYDPEYRKKVYTAMSIELIRRLAVQLAPLSSTIVAVPPIVQTSTDTSASASASIDTIVPLSTARTAVITTGTFVLPITTRGLSVDDYTTRLQAIRDETQTGNADAAATFAIWSAYVVNEYRKIGLNSVAKYTRPDRAAVVFYTKNIATFLVPTKTTISDPIAPETHSRAEALALAAKRYRTISARPIPMLAYCPFQRSDAALLEFTNTSILEAIVTYKSPVNLHLLSNGSVSILPPDDSTLVPATALFPFNGYEHLVHTPEWRALGTDTFSVEHINVAIRYRLVRTFDLDDRLVDDITSAWRKIRTCISPFLHAWIRAGLTAKLIHTLGLAPHPVVFTLLDADPETIINGLCITPHWLKTTYPGMSIDMFAMFRPDSCRAMLFLDARTSHAFKDTFAMAERQPRSSNPLSFFEQSTLFTKK